jgi:tRNA (cytidine32/uridine32-2'-O)-methyltransferase
MEHISIVLVRPQQPGNIGMVARALANHGIGKLVLVQPQGFDVDRARWMAPKAHHIIDNARFCSTIQEAVEGAVRVIATSARPRRWDRPVWEPQQAADEAIATPVPTAFVFGPEDAGLSTEDLMAAHGIMSLPTEEVRSLNLSQAVTVTCANLQAAHIAGLPEVDPPAGEPAPMKLHQAVVQEAVEVLDAAGYLRGRSAVQVHGTLYRMFGRARPSKDEAAILRGMTKQLLWWFRARAE